MVVRQSEEQVSMSESSWRLKSSQTSPASKTPFPHPACGPVLPPDEAAVPNPPAALTPLPEVTSSPPQPSRATEMAKVARARPRARRRMSALSAHPQGAATRQRRRTAAASVGIVRATMAGRASDRRASPFLETAAARGRRREPLPCGPPMEGFVLPSLQATEPTPTDGHEALVRVRPRLATVDIARASINVHLGRAVATALHAVPKIQALRPDMVRHMPLLPIAQIDDIQDLAIALWYANALCTKRPRADKAMAALYDEARPLRQHLLASAELLASSGLLDTAVVGRIREGRGSQDLTEDLTALSVLFRRAWSKVRNKTVVSQEEVERADALGQQLLTGLAKKTRHARRATPMETSHEERLRCFVLFIDAYDWARRAATYLRWREQDADLIVPSLYRRTLTRSERVTRRRTEPAGTPPPGGSPKAGRRRRAKR
jgi:hypothetical protein